MAGIRDAITSPQDRKDRIVKKQTRAEKGKTRGGNKYEFV